MELREFIKETLVQVAEGVKGAQDEYGKIVVLIAPKEVKTKYIPKMWLVDM